MLLLSEVLLQHHELTSFDELLAVVKNGGGKGEMFFRMDVKPPFLLSLIHISEPTRLKTRSRMPSSA